MKKLLTIALIALSGFALPSCGDDDEAKQQDPTPTPTAPAIEGNWKLYAISLSTYDANGHQIGQDKNEKYTVGTLVHTYTAPSVYAEMQNNNNTATGTYSKNGSVLNIVNNGTSKLFPTGSYSIDSLTTTRLVLRDTIPNSTGGGKTIIIRRSVR